MTLLLISLSLLYVWVFVKNTRLPLPDWFIHLILLPGLAFGLSYLPVKVLLILASCGIVYVIETVVHRQAPKEQKRVTRRKSNIPPPP